MNTFRGTSAEEQNVTKLRIFCLLSRTTVRQGPAQPSRGTIRPTTGNGINRAAGFAYCRPRTL